jgi:hypothetical protein
MTGSAIEGRITPGSAKAQLEACSREGWDPAEGKDKNMYRIGGLVRPVLGGNLAIQQFPVNALTRHYAIPDGMYGWSL